jgi:hypothetical protein
VKFGFLAGGFEGFCGKSPVAMEAGLVACIAKGHCHRYNSPIPPFPMS